MFPNFKRLADDGQTLKEQFLRDALALLKQAGGILARSGFAECRTPNDVGRWKGDEHG